MHGHDFCISLGVNGSNGFHEFNTKTGLKDGTALVLGPDPSGEKQGPMESHQ